MKCLSCEKPLRERIGDFDYTRLAGLRGKTVIMSDATLLECEGCGYSSIDIPRMAALHRELDAAKKLPVKRLWCRFTANEWVIVVEAKSA
jgi:hypothetical protein